MDFQNMLTSRLGIQEHNMGDNDGDGGDGFGGGGGDSSQPC